MRKRDTLKTLNQIHNNTYCHKAFQNGELVSEASTPKVCYAICRFRTHTPMSPPNSC